MFRHRLSVLMILGAALIGAAALPAAADPAMHGRISYEAGGAMIKGTGDADWGYATVNTLVLPSDTLWADSGALLELEMVGGAFLRMADQSKAEVVSLPPSAVIRGWTGSFYVHRTARSTGDYLFQAPAATVVVDNDTHARIDVVESGATTVSVRWGHVTVRTETGSPVAVTAGKRVYIDPGFLPSVPQPFDTGVEDDFDAWSRERAKFIAVGPDVIPSTYRVSRQPLGVADLAHYGDWVYVDNTPYWRPTVVVDYVPYRSGIWSYVPAYGHVWVGDYPFSYVTSHYGRWTYTSSYGWLWTYRDVWAPAWVAAVRSGPNFIWTPLDPFNRPCYIGGYRDSFSAYWDFGTFRFSIHASSYCPADRLFYGYGFSYPGRPGAINIIGDDVQIWNIYGNTVNINFPWLDGRYPVREFSPRRVVRGPDALRDGQRTLRATDRINQLERSRGRAQFAAVERTGARQERTTLRAGERDANVRRITADRARSSEGTPFSHRVSRSIRGDDTSERDTTTRTARAFGADGARSGSERGAEGVRGSDADRSSRTLQSRTLRTREGLETSPRADAARTGGDEGATARVTREPRNVGADRTGGEASGRTLRTREPDQARTPERSVTSTDRATRTPDRSADTNRVTRTPERAGTDATVRRDAGEPRTIRLPGRSGDTETRTPSRSVPTEAPRASGRSVEPEQTRTQTRSAAPDTSRTQTRSTAPDVSRTPTRVETPRTVSPRTNAPDRTPDRSGNTGSRGSVDRSSANMNRTPTRTPAQGSVRTITLRGNEAARSTQGGTAPHARSTTPRTTQSPARTAPAPNLRSSAGRATAAAPRATLPPTSTQRSTTVNRTPTARTQAPRHIEVPTVTPRSVQTPQRQAQTPRMTAPRSIETPRVQAPQRIQTPRVSTPRSIETPRIQAPQRQIEVPRIEAPQRQIQAPQLRSGISAPQSRGGLDIGGRGSGGGGRGNSGHAVRGR
jgi:hypothetical protein